VTTDNNETGDNGLPTSPHKTVMEARGETEALINNARGETRKRRDTTVMVREYYAGFFADSEAVVVRGEDSAGHVCYAVWIPLEWCVVCPDGGHRCTMRYDEKERADKKAAGKCLVDFDADVQTPCPGGMHTVDKVAPYTEPVF
jgi:hypothetical protein